MRKAQLRIQAERYLNEDNRGSYRDKKYRHFVIHKMIDGLFFIRDLPPKWHALTSIQIQKLVSYWQKKKIKTATIMKYLTVIRKFLKTINHLLLGIDNISLGLLLKKFSKKSTKISEDFFLSLSEPIAKLLIKFQVYFGLTLSESMRLIPDIHIQEQGIWVTREIASNSQDRVIPVRSDSQNEIIQELMALIKGNQSLISAFGYDAVRHIYRTNLASNHLPSKNTYRYWYAQMIYKELSLLLTHYELTLLIMREMGLQSRVTLWGYLNE
jgi:hypothetical protein